MKPVAVASAGLGPAPSPAERPLELAVTAMKGAPLTPPAAGASFRGAAVDSRRVTAGNLFFALPGERVDGFDYCAAAEAAGAAAVVVEAARGVPAGVSIPVIAVSNPRDALADLARAVRREFAGQVVGVTGSNGKTTTKELCAAALGAAGTVLRTQGNFNTEVGLPLTILSATGREAWWVLEMAMRGRGQIALLADIARPDVGVITNVAGAHLELLGSLDEIARAKGELFAALGPRGLAVFPADDPRIEAQAAHLPESRKLRFGEHFGGRADAGPPPPDVPGSPAVGADLGLAAEVAVVILESWGAGAAGQVIRFSVNRRPVVARLPLIGAHNARNAAAALAVAAALGVPAPAAAQALADTVLPPHRSLPHAAAGRIVIDDCYNANPASMRAALTMLLEAASGSRGGAAADASGGSCAFAVLGDMLELGPDAARLHRVIGREFGAQLAGLAVVGPLSRNLAEGAASAGMDPARIIVASEPASAARELASLTRPGDWILVKASRGMGLERAVDTLLEHFRNPS